MRALAPILILALSDPGQLWAAPPGEVGTLQFSRDGRLSWPRRQDATRYNVYRGRDPRLPDSSCRIEGLAVTEAWLSEQPAPGTLFYYLVTAVNADGEGVLRQDGGVPVPNLDPCNNDSDGDGIRDSQDNCPTLANPDQADQNADGVGDRCDPRTYDFEADAIGFAPAGTTAIGGASPSFQVRDLGGDLAVGYDASGIGVNNRFDRLDGGMPFQDTTVWLDYQLAGEYASLELWSDGSYSWNAGSGLILQLSGVDDLRLYERYGASVPVAVGPAVPTSGRIRIRLLKGFASESTLHVDAWDGSAWQNDYAQWPIADDRLHRGRITALGDYVGARRAIRRITVEHAVPALSLVLRKDAEWSEDWKLFQRDALNRATIPVRFYYRLPSAGRIRARVVWSANRWTVAGHDWSDHQQPLGAADVGVGEIAIDRVPTGGNYDIELELVEDRDPTRVLSSAFLGNLAVGDVWLAGGQSNMSGYSGTMVGAETPIDEAHLFHNDGSWKRASEPMDDGTGQRDRISAESPQHSLLLRFAKEIYRATGVPVGIIPGPLGGTNLYDQWQRDPSAHANRGTLYGSLLHRARLQGLATPPTGLLWFQGESDALALRTTAEYRRDLEGLVANLREDLGSPGLYFINAQLGTFSGANLPDWLAIQEAQRQQEQADARTALIATADQPRSDAIHFSVAAYKAIGLRFAEAVRELVMGESIDAQAHLVAARRVGLGDRIELDYDAPISGGAPALFSAADSLGAAAVTGVAIAGNTLSLALDRPLSGPASVSYGWSVDPAAAWLSGPRGNAVACFAGFAVP